MQHNLGALRQVNIVVEHKINEIHDNLCKAIVVRDRIMNVCCNWTYVVVVVVVNFNFNFFLKKYKLKNIKI